MDSTRRNRCLPAAADAALGELASRKRRNSIRQRVRFAVPIQHIYQDKVQSHGQWDRFTEGVSIIWSFAESDIKTMVLPVATFGVCSALGGEQFFQNNIPITDILSRTPLAILWTWMNVLLLSISNQRSPESITEDRINKPWRPIASGRINADQSRRLLLAVAPVVMITGAGMGISQETFWAIAGSWYYSDLGGADDSWLLRQVLNGIAYLVYGAGVCRVLAGPEAVFLGTFWTWLFMISVIVTTTIQVQDLKDEEGDRLRNRNTAPIILGNKFTRASIALAVGFWSCACPLWWQVKALDMASSAILGFIVAYRASRMKSQAADKKTFLIWTFWMISLFILPAIKNGNENRSQGVNL
jgi:4-hydroxybenzoate polyprenyltransferase